MFHRVLLATLVVAVWGTSTVTGSVLQSRQNLDDGKVLAGPVPITSGKEGERTPTGTHRVLWKDKDHVAGHT